MKAKRRGISYKKRVADINAIYEKYAATGISNVEIWRRYIYPCYGISERTFYNMLSASVEPANSIPDDMMSLFDFEEDGKSH